ncbi:Magnesium-dependent phosphatase-1/arcaheal type [Parasponia andersonii]|uniref:Magnesium-dependent phosphatase-1/arcaheal type n=1 Tax=Parasponia andersonii TaxID=3476 RepID=A0A2P5A507_PARAD|nr:Magnesium-dependent phosphatase-1/arcaheal type [Parasponia andersonii]
MVQICQYTNLPHLIVFDLDYSLWPVYCEFYCEDDEPELGLFQLAFGYYMY